MIVDLILLLIFAVCVLSGYRKGVILSLCSLLVLAVSCLGAVALEHTLTPKAAEWLEPKVTAYVAGQIQDGVEQTTENALEQTGEAGLTIGGQQVTLGDLAGILKNFGLDVEESAQNAAQNMTAPIVQSVAQAVSRMIVEPLAGVLIFLAGFLVIYLVLRGVCLIVNLVDLVPVVHTLNHAGGGLIGALTGALLLCMAMGVLVRTGLASQETFGGPVSRLLRLIVERML